MRILVYALHFKPYIGGAEIFVEELMKRSKHKLTIVTRRGSLKLKSYEKMFGHEVYRVGKGKYDKYVYPYLAYLKGLKLHKDKKFDVVHSIMANHAGIAGMWFSEKTKVPFLLNLQTGQTFAKLRKYNILTLGLQNKIYKKASKVHAISNYLAKHAKDKGAKDVVVVPNGVDVKRLKNKKKGRMLVTISRLSKKNGVEDIIDALRFLDDVKLLIVGSGELEGKIKKKIKRLNLSDRVIFAGEVSHSKIYDYIYSADAFIRPSLSEGQGIAFLEAMACGIPVIATPVGGIPDFLKDNVTGYFCKVGDCESIAKVVCKVLDKDNSKVVKNAYKLVKEKYQWKDVIQKIDKLYEGLR